MCRTRSKNAEFILMLLFPGPTDLRIRTDYPRAVNDEEEISLFDDRRRVKRSKFLFFSFNVSLGISYDAFSL